MRYAYVQWDRVLWDPKGPLGPNTTLTGFKFTTPYNPRFPNLWKQAPKSFTVNGSYDCIRYYELLHVTNTGLSGHQQFTGRIPCEKQDAYKCWEIFFKGNLGARCNCVSVRMLKWFHSEIVSDLIDDV